MEKIRCPHCGAVNQDVTPEDNCWQCGKRLGSAPAAATETTTEANSAGSMVDQVTDRQRIAAQRNLPTLEERVAIRKAERKRNRVSPAVIAIVIVILIVLVFLIAQALKHH